LHERGDERIHYTFSQPRPDGQTALTLTPLELLDRLAALIPPPRRHRHHYHGVFAPHAPLRARVTARAGRTLGPTLPPNSAATGGDTGVALVAAPLAQHPEPPEARVETPARRRAAYLWVRLLARIYECLPLRCPRCASEMRLIAFITAPQTLHAILAHLGEPTTAPPLAPRARAPPDIDAADDGVTMPFDHSPLWDPIATAPDPGFEFNQPLGA
jgi:hypothetical protein